MVRLRLIDQLGKASDPLLITHPVAAAEAVELRVVDLMGCTMAVRVVYRVASAEWICMGRIRVVDRIAAAGSTRVSHVIASVMQQCLAYIMCNRCCRGGQTTIRWRFNRRGQVDPRQGIYA